jgi:hypothetical protein
MSRSIYGKLSLLKSGGTSNRLIDLVTIKERNFDNPGWASAPMFANRRLNSSFVLKHTLRKWERNAVGGPRAIVTKLIIPMCEGDLDMGGYSIFVESPNFERDLAKQLQLSTSSAEFKRDFSRLRALAGLPSFDPYLLREFFDRSGEEIDPCYFVISDRQLGQITQFVAGEIDALVKKALGDSPSTTMAKSKKLAEVLFQEENSEELKIFREALNMTAEEYREGVLGWKGTLYYSWQSHQCYEDLTTLLKQLQRLDHDRISKSDRREMREMMRSIAEATMNRWNRLHGRLEEYNKEFRFFVDRGDPATLKGFMLRAPSLFIEMGEDLSRLQQVAHYWQFWMKNLEYEHMSVHDSIDLLKDFNTLLSATEANEAA